jgi:hypothetical protein
VKTRLLRARLIYAVDRPPDTVTDRRDFAGLSAGAFDVLRAEQQERMFAVRFGGLEAECVSLDPIQGELAVFDQECAEFARRPIGQMVLSPPCG